MLRTLSRIARRGLTLLALGCGALFVSCVLWAAFFGRIWIKVDLHAHGYRANESFVPDRIELAFRDLHHSITVKKLVELDQVVIAQWFWNPVKRGLPRVLEWGTGLGAFDHPLVCRCSDIEVHAAIPMAVMAICLLPMIRARLRLSWRARRGMCRECGYNLSGNSSGRCPECGTTVVSCLTG